VLVIAILKKRLPSFPEAYAVRERIEILKKEVKKEMQAKPLQDGSGKRGKRLDPFLFPPAMLTD
jgi:hypothetical protein